MEKTIELRGADSLPSALTPALGALAKGLYYDERALAEAEALSQKLTFEQAEGSRREIARLGLGAELAGEAVSSWAQKLVTIARAGLERLHAANPDPRGDETRYLDPLAELVAHGDTPADRLLQGIDPKLPLAAQVVALARL